MLLQYNTFNNPIAVVFTALLQEAVAVKQGRPGSKLLLSSTPTLDYVVNPLRAFSSAPSGSGKGSSSSSNSSSSSSSSRGLTATPVPTGDLALSVLRREPLAPMTATRRRVARKFQLAYMLYCYPSLRQHRMIDPLKAAAVGTARALTTSAGAPAADKRASGKVVSAHDL